MISLAVVVEQGAVRVDVQHRRLSPVVGRRASRAGAPPLPPAGTSRSTSANRAPPSRPGGERRSGRAARASPRARRSTGRRRRRPGRPGSRRQSSGRALTAPEPSKREAGDLDALEDGCAGRPSLVGQTEHRLAVEGEAAGALVQAGRQPLRAPVAEHAPHVGRHLVLAGVELRGVADLLLALEDLGQLLLLGWGAEGDVAGAVVAGALGIGLPDLDAGGHQLLHRRLEVVVPDHPAGDPRRPGRDPGFVDHQRLLPRRGEVPGGGQPVHAGADHQVARRLGQGRHRRQCSGGSQPSSTWGFQSSPTVLESGPRARARAGGTSRGGP